MNRRNFVASLAGAGALVRMAPVEAQGAYPQRPIKVIVPFPPGGATDNSARVIGRNLGQTLGQSMVIDNRVGANGRVGTEAVALAAPDGYTLLLGGIGALTIAPHLEKVPYDPLKDFTPVSCLVTYDTVLVVHPSLPVSSVPELIDYLKKNGERTNFASSGPGGPYHMAGELFKSMAQVEMTHVPYKGDGAAIVDLMGGTVQLMFTSTSAAVPHIRSGKVKLIASGSSKRTPVFPDVKTVDEQGVKGYALDSWAGLFGPANLPAPIVQTLHAAVRKGAQDAALQETILGHGSTWVASAPDDFARFVREEHAKWGRLVRERKLTI
ncbi:MAG: tripartite tricarboxylate transporter substrate binding protein [Comamonadaceae bacterium]|nr:MAG: tripartite tricarboxylate transporter substrate binding protein [Comamonadaceae bacterium]